MQSLSQKLFMALFKEATKAGCIYRKYSAAILKNDKVLSIGYARTIDQEKCENLKTCPRETMRLKYSTHAEFFEVCRVAHAEMDAILRCERTKDLEGATLYLLGLISSSKEIYKDAFPCNNCLKYIKLVGIRKINIVQSSSEIKEYKLW